ncbi:MAG: pyruvate ferredoxin oxidoreductase [Elusimicrobia bacterium RIFOXYA2_FULL_39_19]|nr:MAG: pyruvate ferredoxin oxidoreductase [Elusimicrobia bacterium RIFOXYA2_FULL_39_19]
MKKDISVFIGGKAGEGIDQSGTLLAKIITAIGYNIFVYRDYPSIIRGGHTYAIIRGSERKITAHTNSVDYLLALNQDCLDLHKDKISKDTVVLFDSETIKTDALPAGIAAFGLPLTAIIKQEQATAIMRNSVILGSFCKAAGIKWETLEQILKANSHKELELNLKVAKHGFEKTNELKKTEVSESKNMPVVTGNDAITLGLLNAGLEAYCAYPMTPTSGILHTLASLAEDFSLKVIHAENEIAVMLMAEGLAYAGKKTAVGTSGGGFCLMTEGLSLAGMAEIPVVIVLGQRPGPSTGLPTYTCQTELQFALYAGQGEFARFMVAPGDAEEAYYWSTLALDIAWKYQMPSFILTDKSLSESNYSFNAQSKCFLTENKMNPALWDKKGQYKRYQNTDSGISPLAFPAQKDAVVKVNSYEHDEAGLTTEEADVTKVMQDRRLNKGNLLAEELKKYQTVQVYGKKDAKTALVCWGSNKGVCIELGEKLGLRIVQPVVLSPFPMESFTEALKGAEKTIYVENNATGQLAGITTGYGFKADKKILKYDGRPFTLEELEKELRKLLP